MESLSTAEILQLALYTMELVDAQFEYWLAVTFAVIVASYSARNHLNRRIRLVLSGLYILVTFVFFFRYVGIGFNGVMLIDAAKEQGVAWRSVRFLGTFRIFAWVVGSIVTLWFLNTASVQSSDSET